MRDEVIITRPPQRPIERPERTTSHVEEIFTRAQLEPIELPKETTVNELTFWDKLRLVPFIFTILRGYMSSDLKTTLTGVIGGGALIVAALTGFTLSPDIQQIAVGLLVALLGKFSAGETKKD